MKYALFAIALLTTVSAFAEEGAAQPELSKEQLYTVLCQPGSALEKGMDASQQKDARKFRLQFQAFLANPSVTVKQLEKAQAKQADLDLGQQIGFAFAVAFTCGAADALKEPLLAQGCTRPDGKKLSAAKAIELCQPILAKIKADQLAPTEPTDSGSVEQ